MKRHFEVLDGLRGTAALLVVIFHLFEGFYQSQTYALNPLRHAYLAVDFFFLLSGFVVGYAYDDRWPRMSVGDFLRIRLIRLHPLVLLGVALGALGYWFDPFAGNLQHVRLVHLAANVFFGVLLLPFVSLPNRYRQTHPLNGPCWSLLQEYLANIAYALVAPRLGRRALVAVVVVAAGVLLVAARHYGHLQAGWGWDNAWMAPVRVAYPFFMGLLLFRFRLHFRVPAAVWVLSAALLALFAAPAFLPAWGYEAGCVILVFPVLVAAGAGSLAGGGPALAFCRWGGRLSYPLYLLHYPFISIFINWVNASHATLRQALPVMGALLAFFLLLAWVAVRFYDEPVRAWLSARFRPAPRPLQAA
ncbi:acyltransferase [Hymenobacter sp. RP-2-7]|uniref:Acyltransferase n=1 Tax=Hymenobacter polaris TaxID=2682546 RepID=A0A7Y0FLH0_9BACT|nr:acyltransferase [Hymenobacter polaris]NML64797.1 acyltransferase [Hymenobacter polaris]